MNRIDKDKWLKEKVQLIYDEHKGLYGYRRITLALNTDASITSEHGTVNHKRVKRIMSILGLKSKIRVKKYKSYKGTVGKIASNVLDRDFSTTSVFQKLVTDVTEFKVCRTKIYLSPLIDLHTKEVLGYSYSESPSVSLVVEMLEKSLDSNKYSNLILHSDQGFQYQNIRYRSWLENKGITQSMSRKGNCLDNAVAENFFSHLKAEFYHINKFRTKEDFLNGLDEYIKYYNNKRIVTKLKMPPIQYREQSLAAII